MLDNSSSWPPLSLSVFSSLCVTSHVLLSSWRPRHAQSFLFSSLLIIKGAHHPARAEPTGPDPTPRLPCEPTPVPPYARGHVTRSTTHSLCLRRNRGEEEEFRNRGKFCFRASPDFICHSEFLLFFQTAIGWPIRVTRFCYFRLRHFFLTQNGI